MPHENKDFLQIKCNDKSLTFEEGPGKHVTWKLLFQFNRLWVKNCHFSLIDPNPLLVSCVDMLRV